MKAIILSNSIDRLGVAWDDVQWRILIRRSCRTEGCHHCPS